MGIAQVALVSTQARRRRTFPSGWEQTGNQLMGNQLPLPCTIPDPALCRAAYPFTPHAVS